MTTATDTLTAFKQSQKAYRHLLEQIAGIGQISPSDPLWHDAEALRFEMLRALHRHLTT